MGSASELEYHLLLARDLKLIKPKDHAKLSQRAIELKRMLTALHQKLKTESYFTPIASTLFVSTVFGTTTPTQAKSISSQL
jgi:23S rRNA-intervening sequence protein